MANPDYSALVARQRLKFFLSGSTRPAAWRKARLEAAQGAVHREPRRTVRAARKDLPQRHRLGSHGRRLQCQGGRLRSQASALVDGQPQPPPRW